MKKITMLFVVVLGLTLVLSISVFAQGRGRGGMAGRGMWAPEASGVALWKHLKAADYTQRWEMWPGKDSLYTGTEPHGALLTTYVNRPALRSIVMREGVMQHPAIIVKENYMPDKKLAALTVMYKVKGYNPEAGDWFWAKYAPDGKVEAEGKVAGCINCHAKAKGNDYLFTGKLK